MKQKNHDFLIEIFEEVHKKNQKSILMLIGGGELEKTIKEKIRSKNLENFVIFLNNVPNVNEYYQAMDVFVLPSLYEGLPVVGIEAQTSGLKCVFANTISSEVKITNNVTFLGLDDSTKKWAEEILKNKNYYKREDMTVQVTKSGYSIKEEAKKMQRLYEKIGENS